MHIETAKVCKADAEFLHRLMNDQSIWDALDEVPTQLKDWVDAIAAWERDPDEEDYIIFDDGAPIGWLGVNGLLSENKVAYIKMMGLLPQYQHKGIGLYVLSQFLGILRSRGFAAAVLYTDQNNCSAQKCYMRCGFKVTEEFAEEMANGHLARRYKIEIAFS